MRSPQAIQARRIAGGASLGSSNCACTATGVSATTQSRSVPAWICVEPDTGGGSLIGVSGRHSTRCGPSGVIMPASNAVKRGGVPLSNPCAVHSAGGAPSWVDAGARMS